MRLSVIWNINYLTYIKGNPDRVFMTMEIYYRNETLQEPVILKSLMADLHS